MLRKVRFASDRPTRSLVLVLLSAVSGKTTSSPGLGTPVSQFVGVDQSAFVAPVQVRTAAFAGAERRSIASAVSAVSV